MKKFMIFLAILLFLPAYAMAYSVTILDDPEDNFPGANGTTETYSITVETNPELSISILTNQPQYAESNFTTELSDWLRGGFLPSDDNEPAPEYADVADLFLDLSGNGAGWDYVIPLVPHDNLETAGQVYQINSSIIYGTFFRVPYKITSGIPMPERTGTWTWNRMDSITMDSNPDWNIVYSDAGWDWEDVFGQESVRILWATASCGNDVVNGDIPAVPEPATMLLLGTGLIGLAGFGRKKLLKK